MGLISTNEAYTVSFLIHETHSAVQGHNCKIVLSHGPRMWAMLRDLLN